jgi:selenocysteine lyase/cysteine desulfurase
MKTENMHLTERVLIPRRTFVRGLAAFGLLPLTQASGHGSQTEESRGAGAPQTWPGENDPGFWRWIRQQFLIPPDEAYFNTGTLGACPRQVLDAVIDSMRNTEKTIARYDYRPEHTEYIVGYRPQEELRKKAAGILNATAGEIALVQNATMGLNFIANGLELRPGDEVLITDQEHPGAQGPWDLRAKREGILVKQLVIPIPTPDPQTVIKIFAGAIGPRTRVIAFPHVTSHHGIIMPVREICALAKERAVFTLVDGAQAVGQLRVDVKNIGCDAYATSPHKWLLAPPGTGLLYVREAREKDVWATLASASWDNYNPASGLYRLMQYGTGNKALQDGLDAAFDFYVRIGPERIEQRIIGLADSLRNGLEKIKGVTIFSPTHPALAGAIVNYGVTGVTGLELQDELWNRKKYRVRAGGPSVRHSVHLYNSPEEIEGTLEVVRTFAAK